ADHSIHRTSRCPVKRIAIVWVAGCAGTADPQWQLDHDRIVAVRATPSHLPPGASAKLDALVAHRESTTDVEIPVVISATGPFESIVQPDGTILAPSDAVLAQARQTLRLAPTAPVPVEVTAQFGGLVALKTVWLGDSMDDPELPAVIIDGATPPDTL